MKLFTDLSGNRYSRLLVIKRVENVDRCASAPSGQVAYLCKCDCGKEKVIRACSLRDKRGTKSCGCHRRDRGAISLSKSGASSYAWRGGPVSVRCKSCGKQFYIKKSRVLHGRGIFCSRLCMGVWRSKNRTGENSTNWHGGKSFELYTKQFTKEVRLYIRKRDGYTCMVCGAINIELHVHHIDYDKKNCREENLISLCTGCHTRTNGNRMHWRVFLQNKIKEIYGIQ